MRDTTTVPHQHVRLNVGGTHTRTSLSTLMEGARLCYGFFKIYCQDLAGFSQQRQISRSVGKNRQMSYVESWALELHTKTRKQERPSKTRAHTALDACSRMLNDCQSWDLQISLCIAPWLLHHLALLCLDIYFFRFFLSRFRFSVLCCVLFVSSCHFIAVTLVIASI
jgi:hypothetical protein